MIKIIYKELPIDEIYYLNRFEFSPTGSEKDFYYSPEQVKARRELFEQQSRYTAPYRTY